MSRHNIRSQIEGNKKRIFRFRVRMIVIVIVLSLIALNSVTQASQPAEVNTPFNSLPTISPIRTDAQAAAMIDVTSGRLLLSYQGDKRMLIASLTKIMTAIVAIENGNLSDQVQVSDRAVGIEGSSLYLKRNETMSLEHLLYGLMLRSGNDAAMAIAEHVGGSMEGFAYLMNRKAEEIGMYRSHFVNPHGLNAEEHYSTANDLAILTAYALNNAVFSEIVKTKIKKVPNPHEKWDYTWYNKNKMLGLFDGSDGVKTGYTKNAGRCLVSSATRDGRQIVVVTLNDGNDWVDHTRWLNYGFAEFSPHVLIEKGDEIEGYPYVAGRSLTYPLLPGEDASLTTSLQLIDEGSIHYQLGERGKVIFALNDQVIGSIPFYERDSRQMKGQHQDVTASMYKKSIAYLLQQYNESFFKLFKALVNG